MQQQQAQHSTDAVQSVLRALGKSGVRLPVPQPVTIDTPLSDHGYSQLTDFVSLLAAQQRSLQPPPPPPPVIPRFCSAVYVDRETFEARVGKPEAAEPGELRYRVVADGGAVLGYTDDKAEAIVRCVLRIQESKPCWLKQAKVVDLRERLCPLLGIDTRDPDTRKLLLKSDLVTRITLKLDAYKAKLVPFATADTVSA